MTDFQRIVVGLTGTGTTALVEQSGDHPATICAAAATAVFMVVSTLYKIKNGK